MGSTDQSDDEFATNFENLKLCLRTVCRKYLCTFLKEIIPNYNSLKQRINKDTFISDKSYESIQKEEKSFSKLSFQEICDIFRSGVCDEYIRPPVVGWQNPESKPSGNDLDIADDILRMWIIWEENILGNDDENLNDNTSNDAWTVLLGIAQRAFETKKSYGVDFWRGIQDKKNNGTQDINIQGAQIGNNNSMETKFEEDQHKEMTFVQCGKENKMIIQLKDQRDKSLEIKSSGEFAMTLRSTHKTWKAICDRTSNVNIEEINQKESLKDNGVRVNRIEKGCLVISVHFDDTTNLKDHLDNLFKYLFESIEAERILKDHNVKEMNVSGYIYRLDDYFLNAENADGTIEVYKFHQHVTLHLQSATTCDVDVFLSGLLKELVTNDFKTEVAEKVRMVVKGDIIRPSSKTFSTIQEAIVRDVNSHIQELEKMLSSHGNANMRIAKIQNVKKTIHVFLETKTSMGYRTLVMRDGILLNVLRNMLESEDAATALTDIELIKCGILIDTKFADELENEQQDLVFYISSKSEIQYHTLPKIITTLIGGKEGSDLKDVEQLRIKAVLSDRRVKESEEKKTHTIHKPHHSITSTPYIKSKNLALSDERRPEYRRKKIKHDELYENKKTRYAIVEGTNEDLCSDSGQETDENDTSRPKPIPYQDPEYTQSELDTAFTDSGFDTLEEETAHKKFFLDDESLNSDLLNENTDLVVNGIKLSTEKCKSLFKSKNPNPFKYPKPLPTQTLKELYTSQSSRFKRCSIEIESAHQAVCTNLNFADSIKEILISGRSKCGRAYTEDEVVVEILTDLKDEQKSTTKVKDSSNGSTVYGRVMGILKRNRYENLDHPVLVCTKDEFGKHAMKPLCKTVPKIHILHQESTDDSHVDVYSYNKKEKCVEFKNTLPIDHYDKGSYCFLVAILKWDNMYPTGIVLKAVSTKGNIESGIGILRLQFRIPYKFSKETIEACERIQDNVETISYKNKELIDAFTIDDHKTDLLDSAFSIKKIDSSEYRVGIHIADPTSIIKKGDPIDVEARKRGGIFEIGRGQPIVHMFPKFISVQRFCFKLNEVKTALTLFFTIMLDKEEDFIYDIAIENTFVKSVRSVPTEEVQDAFKCSKNVTDDTIPVLNKIAHKLRHQRIGDSIHYTELEQLLQHDPDFMKCVNAISILEELHLFTNHEIAKFILKKFPDNTPCRCHNRPPEEVLVKWNKDHPYMGNVLFHLQGCEVGASKCCSIKNEEMNNVRYIHVLPIQRCVWNSLNELVKKKHFDKLKFFMGVDEIHPYQALALEEWKNIQEIAEYKCSTKKGNHDHFALRLPVYTSFTAPLRRYIDLVVHRMVHAIIEKEKNVPYSNYEVMQICNEMNEIKRHQKQFFNSCQTLIFGHQLHKRPHLFNGFIQNVSVSEINLCMPSLRLLPRSSKSLAVNLLQTRQKPILLTDEKDRNILTIKWQNRIYSPKYKTKSIPKENEYLRINPHQTVSFQQLSKWIKIMRSLLDRDYHRMDKKFQNIDQPEQNFVRACIDTVDDVSSEVVGSNFSSQMCHYSLSFNYGQVVVVQMAAEQQRGMMVPVPQLLDITNNVKICLEHMRNPVGVLSAISVITSKDKYSGCDEYINTWVPILSMETATQTVEDESITINDLPITFNNKGGSFSLKYSFVEKRDIEFTAQSIDLLGSASPKNQDKSEEKFYLSGSDFLCIRCQRATNLIPKSYFGAGAVAPQKRYWIGHAKVDDVKFKSKISKGDIIKVLFVCHNKCPVPNELRDKRTQCSVEILRKSDVNRRTELYVKLLNDASELSKAVALRRRIPYLDDFHSGIGARIDLDLKETGITHNADQKKAIRKALTSTFSLIQGPPGTGKTCTGVALVELFCKINHQLNRTQGMKHYIVFCGPSNKSVDLVAGYLLKLKSDIKVLRVYGGALECSEFPIPGKVFSKRRTNTESRPDENLKNVTLHHIIRQTGKPFAEEIKKFDKKFAKAKSIDYKEIREYKKFIGKAVNKEIPNYDAIFCTTSVATSARLLCSIKNSIFQLLIDEAGMCTEPECIATMIATNAKQVVLIGDHQQLRPVIICEDAAKLGLQKSMFEQYAETKTCLTFLRNQYRMHPNLCSFPSKTFYENKLKTINSPKWEEKQPLGIWINIDYPYLFCHLEGQEDESLSNTTEEGNEKSRFNKAEVEQVVRVFLYLTRTEKVQPKNINIMSQYNAQCAKIRQALKDEKVKEFSVNTVVASQGGEWDYVIFSLVRSLPDYRIEPNPTRGWCQENLGFITDHHQINVALTRARKGIIIIGNKKLMKCDHEVFLRLLEEYEKHDCVINAEDFPPKHRT